MKTRPAKERHLLVTMTKEPFQPARLYYSVPDPARVIRNLKALQCVVEVSGERCWQWLFHGEAASLRFPAGSYDDVPASKRPIVLGRIRFPAHGTMTLETNSFERAIEGARFFGPRLGPEVVALRCRMVNRCFAADEGPPDTLMATLDHGVVVVDPRIGEASMERMFAGVPSVEDFNRAADASFEQELESKRDVPMVEDFPLAPEEETPDFQHLTTTLRLRFTRAVEHWRGNTHLTLAAIVLRMVQQSMQGGGADKRP